MTRSIERGDHITPVTNWEDESILTIPPFNQPGRQAGVAQPTPDLPNLPNEEIYQFNENMSLGQQSRLSNTVSDMGFLSVEDQGRNFEFVDFVDYWRKSASRDRRLPSFASGPQDSVHLLTTFDLVDRNLQRREHIDVQGLRWGLLGLQRQSALAARENCDPYRNQFESTVVPPKNIHSLVEAEILYGFRSYVPRHKAEINHYQLRNCITAIDRNSIYYAKGERVVRASLSCPLMVDNVFGKSEPATEGLGFKITCLASSSAHNRPMVEPQSILAVGGLNGEYALLDPNNTCAGVTGFVTHAYNGLVTHVHTFRDRQSSLLKASFCSNDRSLRVLDVTASRFTKTFHYEFAPNASSTSPDGRLTAIVGDCHDTLITDAEQGSTLVTLKAHSDYSFACTWSSNGRQMATGAQDGKIIVWDTRNWARPYRILDAAASCARSLCFSRHGSLITAEENDKVRVYDRQLELVQDIQFFGSIAGVALIDGGEELVIANADQAVGGLLSFNRTAHSSSSNTYMAERRKPDGALYAAVGVTDLAI